MNDKHCRPWSRHVSSQPIWSKLFTRFFVTILKFRPWFIGFRGHQHCVEHYLRFQVSGLSKRKWRQIVRLYITMLVQNKSPWGISSPKDENKERINNEKQQNSTVAITDTGTYKYHYFIRSKRSALNVITEIRTLVVTLTVNGIH